MTLVDLIRSLSNQTDGESYKESTDRIEHFIKKLPDEEFIKTVRTIGIIPEYIEHDSTMEKLYSKASDITLAECFNRLGLVSKVLVGRGDSADIIAQSKSGYNYSLVADAKCFRLSRTAKNQKDFKVANLSSWRGGENEYAVLVAPYYQYPQRKSQIYSKALENNVCLLSWEHLVLLLECNIKESNKFSLEMIWNASKMIARDTSVSMSSECTLLPKMNNLIMKKSGIDNEKFKQIMFECRFDIIEQCKEVIQFWNNEIIQIKKFSREKAIDELIKAKKLNQKIETIKKYIERLEKGAKL